MLELAPGTSQQDLLKWDEAPNGPPPFEAIGGINGFSVDGSGYMTSICSPALRGDLHPRSLGTGIPHSHLGMIKTFTVPG